jgi:DNA-binding response OmpR family regulator
MTNLDGSYRALFVEDDRDTGNAYRLLFMLEGFRVFVVDSISQARDLLTSEQFDLFVVDNRLADTPDLGLTGIDLCREIRQAQPDAVIFSISANATPEHREAAVEAGADRAFGKPCDYNRITQLAKVLLAQSSSSPRP